MYAVWINDMTPAIAQIKHVMLGEKNDFCTLGRFKVFTTTGKQRVPAEIVIWKIIVKQFH